MVDEILRAVALLLVFEGIMPFLSPGKWKEMMLQISEQPDSMLRSFGLGSMLLGVFLLYWLS